MIIAECILHNPLLHEPQKRVPSTEIIWEQTYQGSNDSTQMDVWIESTDFQRVDEAISDDPSVENPVILAEFPGQKMYRFDLTGLGQQAIFLPLVIEVNGVLKKAVGKNVEWLCQVQLPDRNALEELVQGADDTGLDLHIHRMYEEAGSGGLETFSITDAQRETLIAAIDLGFLDIPRDCTLAELGEELGVSESSASERFRRGVKNVIEETIYEGLR